MTVFCKGNYNIKDTEKFRVLNFKNVSQLVYSSLNLFVKKERTGVRN